MKPFRPHPPTIVKFLVAFSLVWTAGLPVHEAGHGLTAQALGRQIHQVICLARECFPAKSLFCNSRNWMVRLTWLNTGPERDTMSRSIH